MNYPLFPESTKFLDIIYYHGNIITIIKKHPGRDFLWKKREMLISGWASLNSRS